MKLIAICGGVLAAIVGLGWLGLRIPPAPFAPLPAAPAEPPTVPLPDGLPAPVARFYRQRYGERIPVITTAVITGRGTMRPFAGIPFPMRFRFTHEAGRNYRHYIEATFFGLPIMKANEYYVGGKERAEIMGSVGEGEKWNQGGNLGMWAELLEWAPSALLTTPGVRWEAVDDETALLGVPFGAARERFVVRFDPASGAIRHWEVMRYRNGADDKVLWIDGMWLDQGRPWVVFDTEQQLFNVPVNTAFTAKGP